jgi:hypothetical protein
VTQDGVTIEAINDHTIRIESKGGFVIRLLIDKATNRPEALETDEPQNASDVTRSTLRRVFSDGRPVGDMVFPFTLDEFAGSKRLMSRQLLSMQINAKRHCSFPPRLIGVVGRGVRRTRSSHGCRTQTRSYRPGPRPRIL